MLRQIEAGAQGLVSAPRRTGDGTPTNPAALALALVGALEQAQVAAHRLLAALGGAPGDDGAPAGGGRAPNARSATTLALVPAVPAFPAGLTVREVDVLRLVVAGQSNREIAAGLSVSERTVERHLENTYRKVGARNRADATAYAIRRHLT